MIIQADASQLEWRVLLELSRDPVGIQEVQERQDTHTNNQVAENSSAGSGSALLAIKNPITRVSG